MGDIRAGAAPSADHRLHDPELIAALLDADAPTTERAPGTVLIETCADCARLHGDLVALARATQEQPAPARPRDFRLTEADAVRLTGEPPAAATRLNRDMPDPRTAAAHASHDTMLVASLADHSLAPDDRLAAERLVADCGLCAALYDDVLAIRTATIELPTPTRPIDYRLTEADAARLRVTGWRRWIASIGGARDSLTRPLAVGLTTLGIIGILVSGAPLLSFGSATSGSAESSPTGAGAGVAAPVAPATGSSTTDASSQVKIAGEPTATAPGPAAVAVPSAGVPVPAGPGATSPGFLADQDRSADSASAGGATASSGAGLTNEVAPNPARGSAPIDATSSPSPVIVLSGLLLVAGLGLFFLRWVARRLGA